MTRNKYTSLRLILLIRFALGWSPVVYAQTAPWQSLGNPDGGMIRLLHRSPDKTVYAAIDSVGIFYSTNGGDAWQPTASSIVSPRYYSLLRASSGNLFLGTLDSFYISTNNGTSWKTALKFRVEFVQENSKGVLFISADGYGIWRSTDQGLQWSRVRSWLYNYKIELLAIGTEDILYASPSNAEDFYRSTDDGATWQSVDSLFYDNGNTMMVSNQNGLHVVRTDKGCIFSIDSGSTWKSAKETIEFRSSPIAIDNRNNFYAGKKNVLLRTSNEGASWDTLNRGISESLITSISPESDSTILVGTLEDGMFRTTDGGKSWVVINTGLSGTIVNFFYLDHVGKLFLGTKTGLYAFEESTFVWRRVDLQERGISVTAMSSLANGNYYIGTSNGLFMSRDFGSQWEKVQSFPGLNVRSLTSSGHGNVFVIAFHPTIQQRVFVRSTDGWNKYWTDDQMLGKPNVLEMIARDAREQLYLTTNNGILLTSTDTGRTWKEFTREVKYFSVDRNDNLVLITKNNSVRISKSDGSTYSLPSYVAAQYTCAIRDEDTIVYAGSEKFGVIRFFPHQYDYKAYSVAQPVTRILALTRDSLRRFYALLEGRGIFRSYPIVSLATPIQLVPRTDSMDIPNPVTFSWKPVIGASRYRFVCTTSSFLQFHSSYNKLIDTITQKTDYTYHRFSQNSTLYWAVQAQSDYHFSGWSNLLKFSTELTIPTVPTYLSPGNATSIYYQDCLLRWEPSAGTSATQIQLAEDDGFVSKLYDLTITDRASLPSMMLPPKRTYFWRVRAMNIRGVSPWTRTHRFYTTTTKPLLDIRSQNASEPPGIIVRENYPNPIIEETSLRFYLPHDTHLQIKLFNSVGKELGTIAEGMFFAGDHDMPIHLSAIRTMNWDSPRTGGVLFYRFFTPNEVITKKLVFFR